jgi:hypothetical protein
VELWVGNSAVGRLVEVEVIGRTNIYFGILDGHFTFAFAIALDNRHGHGCSLSAKIDNSLHYMRTGGILSKKDEEDKKNRSRQNRVNREIPRFGI